jgi:primosomal protein N'
MSDLREQFEKETQNQAIYRKFGIDYHTLKYVKWLESQLTQLQSKWNKLNTRPNDAKAMIGEQKVKLRTIKEHNERAMERLEKVEKYGNPTGVACPKCGDELHGKTCSVKLTYPPRQYVSCPKCGYKTSIFI